MKKLISFFNDHFIAVITCASFVVYATSAAFFFLNNEIVLYGDARSRLLISRGIFDSLTPGLVQLGAVWPPIPQFLFMFTVWNKFFLYTGLAGTFISIAAAVIATHFLAKLVLSLSQKKLITTIALVPFVFNPSFLYMSVIPMSEVLFIMSTIVSTYFLYKWTESKSTIYLPLAAFGALVASLTRYEGLFMPIFGVGVIIFKGYIDKQKFEVIKGHVILYITMAFLGIMLWMFYNQVIYGNFLSFVSGETSRYSRAGGEVAGTLTKGNIVTTLMSYVDAAALNGGIYSVMFIPFAFLLGIFLKKSKYIVPLFLLSSPIIFNFVTLFFGASDIYTFSNAGYLYNTRMGLFILPVIVVSYAILLSRRMPGVIVATILFVQVILLSDQPPVTLLEAQHSAISERGNAQKQLTDWLQVHPVKGKVFISSVTNQTVIFDGRIPQNTVVYEGSGEYWVNALKDPREVAQRIILSPQKGDIIYEVSGLDKNFFTGYTEVYNDKFFRVYDLKYFSVKN